MSPVTTQEISRVDTQEMSLVAAQDMPCVATREIFCLEANPNGLWVRLQDLFLNDNALPPHIC